MRKTKWTFGREILGISTVKNLETDETIMAGYNGQISVYRNGTFGALVLNHYVANKIAVFLGKPAEHIPGQVVHFKFGIRDLRFFVEQLAVPRKAKHQIRWLRTNLINRSGRGAR